MYEPDLFISTSSSDRTMVEWLNGIFYDAVKENVHDIHFRERDGRCVVRMRKPSGLEDHEVLDSAQSRVVDEKIRSRANMAMSNRMSPLDGRFGLRFPDRRIDVRVAITPNLGGQLTVCRLLDQSKNVTKLESLVLSDAVRYCVEQVIQEPSGLILVTGPTGSGKTTTLYAILDALNTSDRNIITIEHPVEYTVDGLCQIDVDQHISFASALRAVLRQDPDIILVGEIRDAETATIAVQASMTGHLVLATLHANNSVHAVTRLVALGIDPQSLSSSLLGVVSQRLVKRVVGCEMVEPSSNDSEWMKKHNIFNSGILVASDECETGAGYIPLMEFFLVDEQIREAIMQKNEEAIFLAACQQIQFEPIAHAGMYWVRKGMVKLSELKRVAGSLPSLRPSFERIGVRIVSGGLMSYENLNQLISRQIEMFRNGVTVRLGQLAEEMGFCSREEIEKIMRSGGD